MRAFFGGRLWNFHLVALPTFDRNTCRNIIDLLTRFSDETFGQWKQLMIALSSDEDSSMRGRIRGVVTKNMRFCHFVHLDYCVDYIRWIF